ncbi:MAG: hypothetical protein ACODAQ_09185 [Phycisphaeraceae bacterium]
MEDLDRLVWALVLLLLLAFLGIAVILALLAAWRNQGKRQQLLDQGKRMRQAYRGQQQDEPTDAWSEAGKRLNDDDTEHERDNDNDR